MDPRLDTLQERLALRPPAPARERRGLPPWELRYVLEAADAVAADSLRPRIAALLGTDGFELHPLFEGVPEPDLVRFRLLAFPWLDRRSFRRADLLEIGYAFADTLDLISVEPDLGEGHFLEPEPPPADAAPQPEGVTDLAFWCWVEGAPPPSRHWALEAMRVPQAWQMARGRGAGVLVAQPDTGVATHAELEGATLRLDLAADLVDGTSNANDPLLASAGNPGHGTATASVLISGEGGGVLGSAPCASLVPIRCIESVVVFDQSRVARALDHARRVGAHVVTMSLGGVPGRALEAALERAVEEGVIVLAAAGNCVGLVVYPARYRRCIAVAGVNAADRPWRGSCRGPEVDVSAPGEFVWRAVRRTPADPDISEISGGQGTSFAVALTAGVVALWLSHHGRGALLAEANRRGVTLQTLCRAALTATARTPPGWNVNDFGSGIIDAEALLRLAPAAIPAVAAEAAVPAEEAGRIATLLPLALEGTATPPAATARNLDLRRYGLEVAVLAFDAARAQAAPVADVEAAGRARRHPSPGLAAALAAAAGTSASTPAPAAAEAAPVAELARPMVGTASSGDGGDERGRAASIYLRILGRSAIGSALEGASAGAAATEAARVLRPTIRDMVDRLQRRFAAGDRGLDAPDPETLRLREQVLGDAERALEKATRDPTGLRLDRRDIFAFEALVHTKGRPALLVQKDTYDPEDPEIDEYWADALAVAGGRIPEVIRSVGRIELDRQHTGTGLLVAPGLLMTNRHVLEALVFDPSGAGGWDFVGHVEVDFKAEEGAKERHAFRITGVAFAGPAQIGNTVDLRKLDLALLTVEEHNAQDAALPPALPLVSNSMAARGRRDVAIAGYPAKPSRLPRTADGRIDPEVLAALERIFRFRYDVKRLALGRIDRRLGTLTGDAEPAWALGHDATTLGGNSGSAVAVLQSNEEGRLPVLALHMGGQWLLQNYAHVLAAVPALRDAQAIQQVAAMQWTQV